MKKINLLYLFGFLMFFASCEFEEQIDPNAPSINSVLTDATLTELNLLVTGTEANMRNGFGNYVTSSGSVAREFYLFDADPRNTEDLLGKDGMMLDNNTFYLTAPYNTRYRVVKNCNILLEALENTENVTEAEKDAYRGFANTVKGYMLFQVLNLMGENGIRVDVADPENLGPFVSQSEAFNEIVSTMETGFSQVQNSDFKLPLSVGFAGFDDAESFGQFNQALTAKILTFAGDYQGALDRLSKSFLDLSADIMNGPQHVFSTASGDIFNPLFKSPQQNGDQIVVHNSMLEDALPGDQRLNKFRERDNPTSQDGLNGTHETALYASSTSPISIIRNEELILLYAECNIQTDNPGEAVNAINVIRSAHGLPDYDGSTDKDALIDELLFQRRYSLWGEGNRMFDLRRYGRLNDQFVPIDRAGDIIHMQFPIPLTEGQ
ncbi:MAG: RagB/SusD family nutrient uptake outer membrane protein [Saprospiraceae bacterium]|nr:RagB/SusD family nutrient uptake outer membrane protein [Saprospiraceae bacterium]